MKESLADTKKWREEQEKNIKYFNNISNMTLPNDSNLPNYDDLADKLFDICLPQPGVDLTRIQKVSRKKMDLSLPKMDKLIEFNMVKPGDRLYITLSSVDREDSLATLLDAKYVRYKNEKMTLNQWGCKVTGWKSIRIYAWAAVEGEIETLQEKRLAYVQEHNEAVK